MKNEQMNDQKRKQEQDAKSASSKNQQGGNQQSDLSQQRNIPPQNKQNAQGNEKSNISVDNEGKIGKAHDQWNNDNNNRNQDENTERKDNQVRSDKTVTEPEIDTPVYDPEKTEKKIPQMGNTKNSK